MELFKRIFFAAVLAGLVAGLAMAAFQQARVVPLILEAEHYEDGHTHADAAAMPAETAASGHSHTMADGSQPWAPADGFERTMFTVLGTTLVGIGFAFVIAAVSVLAGIEITLANGALWGLAGFLTFTLAPALGLPPLLPGMAAADLAERQIWWWGTALATGAAIVGFVKFRNSPSLAIGLALIAIPHIIGAPPAPDFHSPIPAHDATAFVATTFAASMIYWLMAGLMMGWLNQLPRKGEKS